MNCSKTFQYPVIARNWTARGNHWQTLANIHTNNKMNQFDKSFGFIDNPIGGCDVRLHMMEGTFGNKD